MEAALVAKILGVVFAIAIAMQGNRPSEDDWRWLDQFRQAALDALMPITGKRLVEYRSYRDLYHDVQERYFTIAYADGPGYDRNRLIATVVVPKGQSIQQQLLNLHMKDLEASFDSLISKVVVRQYVLTTEKCPAIRARLDALSKLTILLPERDVIILHPVVHRMIIDLGVMRLDATIDDQNNSLVRWAAQTLEALVQCTAG